MKDLVSILSESPFYFTLTVRDRHGLVKRLANGETGIDLSRYQKKVSKFLQLENRDFPNPLSNYSSFDGRNFRF